MAYVVAKIGARGIRCAAVHVVGGRCEELSEEGRGGGGPPGNRESTKYLVVNVRSGEGSLVIHQLNQWCSGVT